MRIELDEACTCKRPRPGYPNMGEPTCATCGFFIVKPSRMKRLRKAARLREGREFRAAHTKVRGRR